MSACITLGYYLTNRPRVRLFQYHRDDHSWAWPDVTAQPNDIRVTGLPEDVSQETGEVAICFHLSASVTNEKLQEVGHSFQSVIHVSISSPTTAWLQHQEQMKELAKTARRVFEMCIAQFPNARRWHLFYAGPAPGAVAVGQQINPTMCPPVQLYEYKHNRTPAYQTSIVLPKEIT